MKADLPPGRRRRRSSSSQPQVSAASPTPVAATQSQRFHEAWPDRLRELRRPLVLAGGLLAAILLVYWRVRGFDFIALDDPVYVSNNLHVRAGLSLPNVVWCFAAFHDGNWIPFTWLSLMLDTTVFGFHAGAYHFTNVLLHVANTVLLFAFLTRATGNQLRSACVAALFALHPLHVESVAWITERKDVLSILFGLLSLLAYVSYAKSRGGWSFAACLLCFVASLLSKQTLVTLPFVFLLLDYWPLGRFAERSARVRVVVEKIPFLALSAAFSAITIVAQKSGHTLAPLASLPVTARCMNALTVYVTYLRQAFFPFDLAVYYPHPRDNITWGAVGGSAALLLAVSLVVVARARRNPFLLVGWAWFLGTLLPMIGIVQVGSQQMADRYTYFPLIGLFLAFVWLVCELVPAGAVHERVLPAASIACLAALGAAAFVQVGYWRDSVTLFRHAVQCAVNNPLATSALGYAVLLRGQTGEGIALLESAVRMAPADAQTQYNVAVGLQSVGRLDEAAEHYRAALALDEHDTEAHTNLGVILCEHRGFREAKDHFLRALAINPEQVQAYENLGTLCVETGEYADAIFYSQRALALDPHLRRCQMNIDVARRALAMKRGF